MDIEMSRPFLEMFGPNVSTVERETWKTHRRIVQQAFTEKNVQLVWSEAELVVEKLFKLWDEQQGRDVHIPYVVDITKKLALMVFSAAALGRRMSWDRELNGTVPLGYSHPFQRALSIVSSGIIARLLTPSWAEGLTPATRTLASGFRDFKKYLLAMVDLYKKQGRLDRDLIGSEDSAFTATENLFMNILVTASEQNAEAEGIEFGQKEVTGNTFLLLFAGHETTAHAIAFGLGLLAAHPDVQTQVYAQIKREYTDMNDLKIVTGVLLEALRMYPALLQLSRNVDEDFTISVASNAPGADEGVREKMFIPANSKIVISVAATHYNRAYSELPPACHDYSHSPATYWPEPEEFRPTRFCQAYNKDAFLGFSTGRKSFAETEGTVVLASILARYEISVDGSKFPEIPGESARVPLSLYAQGPPRAAPKAVPHPYAGTGEPAAAIQTPLDVSQLANKMISAGQFAPQHVWALRDGMVAGRIGGQPHVDAGCELQWAIVPHARTISCLFN
ncbi:hypothetical protein FRC10_006289 [Ceratobasidium sp. 414]|nr:hypothetical protein FRC10_006289 [Ceratobasidium sp. 414]